MNVVYIVLLSALGSWLYLFIGDFSFLFNSWNGDDYSHCYLVFPLVLYVLYSDKEKIRVATGGGLWFGIGATILAVCCFYIGRFGSLNIFVQCSMWLFLCGLFLLVVGDSCIKTVWLPLLLGFFMIPLPPFITRLVTFRLRLVSSALSEKMLQLFQVPVYRDGNIIDLGTIQLQVVDACSGLRYLWPSLLMVLLIGWMFSLRPFRRFILVLLAFPVTIFSNAFRIALTGVLAGYIDPILAEGFFHDFSGWLVYVVSLGLLFACAIYLKKGQTPYRQQFVQSAEQYSPNIVAISLIVLFAFCSVFYGDKVLLQKKHNIERQDFTQFSGQIGDWQGEQHVLSAPVLESLGTDDYYNSILFNNDLEITAYLLISWYDHQTTQHAAHAPTSCLLGGGYEIMEKRVLRPQPNSIRNFAVSQILLEKNNHRILSNFWLMQRGRIVTSEWLNKWYLIQDALMKQRTDGALVRIEMAIKAGQTIEEAQAIMDQLVMDLRQELVPFMPKDYSVQ